MLPNDDAHPKTDSEFSSDWQELIGEALGIDLRSLDGSERASALLAALECRNLARIAAVLRAADAWSQRKGTVPNAVQFADEQELVGEAGRPLGWFERRMLLNTLATHSAEDARLRKELGDLEMERMEYDALVRRFANVVDRQLAISCGGACPVCDQYVVDPNWRSPIRWLARGLINVGRTAVFLFELALVAAVAFLALGAVRELVRLIIGPE